ncbi:ATP-dependent nuclease [Salisediminibacterium halotolerans]|uniref:ATP-dependent nuclease n=1 Tax=Salisediminibacterium halotolerans TaxID=517425 RepID=UPI000F2B07E7|nr:AAA family ATPase [Salisediminibacterium halotolerans]RLJ72286.1 putative ATP-dependent endonuclease of OLD family [Actinophytocola xinjiangensis]RPE85500.1 putative ATP-dependent endonuclease of OLD family [Salisediminibacterium halotolerans]TWG33455.1 putative ATP-dependent endonuclease of OLD family [Salisediminibacterium halotolerans]GEL07066.1 ATP-dependent endonuclease [Salisediminibacterium halotolerans]
MIERIIIKNYKHFQYLDLHVKEDMNILIGDNGTGKSTIFEAIHLALTGVIRNRPVYQEINPFFFNKCITNDFIGNAQKCREDQLEHVPPSPPSIHIELYLTNTTDQDLNKFRGSENMESKDCIGLSFNIEFDKKYEDEYEEYIQNEEISLIPTEFYMMEWKTFGGHIITPRAIPFKSYLIDSNGSAFSNLPQKHFMGIIDNTLDKKQRANLAVLYREYKEQFSRHEEVIKLNDSLNEKKQGSFSQDDPKKLALSLDVSRNTSWETAVNAYIDNIPFENIGTGAQNMLKTIYAVQNRKEKQTILLMEEPENHLSFTNMRQLVTRLSELSEGQQVFVSTHDSYILNKLHLDNLILLSSTENSAMDQLSEDTVSYFQKLPNYNTLRFILSKKVILVEGPADELIVTKCYMDNNGGKVPLDDGIDIFSVNGLSFKRFLDIAILLEIKTFVVTDNDGNYEDNIEQKYKGYKDHSFIHICSDSNYRLKTLEPQFLYKGSNFEKLKNILNRSESSIEELEKYMETNKTDWALSVFLDTTEKFEYPEYIIDAIR